MAPVGAVRRMALEHFQHGRRGADHPGFLVDGGRGQALIALAQLGRLLARAAQVQRRHQGRQQALILPGLGDEIGRALFHGLDRQIHIAMGGDHHHHRLRVDGQNLGQTRQSLAAVVGAGAEIHVQQQHVETMPAG